MLAGMGIVYLFLALLIAVTKLLMERIGRFDAIIPQDAPKKPPAAKAAADDGANIALAIAVAMG